MGSFDQGLAGMVSLRAVNEWIGVINSNLGGSNRTAYKSTKVSFGGGVPQVQRDPRAEANGVQIPDSTLTIANTRIDFGQGTVIQDGELTHFAIAGDGFFAVRNDNDITTDLAPVFYTRDGDFKWSPSPLNGIPILTTSTGLSVLGFQSVTFQNLNGNRPAGSYHLNEPAGDVFHMDPQPFSSGSVVQFTGPNFPETIPPGVITSGVDYYVILSPNFPGGLALDFQLSLTPGGPPIELTGLNSTGPCTIVGYTAISRIGSGATFSSTTTTVAGANPPISVFRFPNNQALKFSKYGATVFDNAQAGNPVDVDDVQLIQSALESSNAALNDTLPELSLAQKLFSAVSKIINIHNSDLDIVINLIR